MALSIDSLVIANDIILFPADKAEKTEFKFGTEYLIFNNFAFRLGLSSNPNPLEKLPTITYGFGLKYSNFGFDYAVVPFGSLGDIQRMSLNIKFGRSSPK